MAVSNPRLELARQSVAAASSGRVQRLSDVMARQTAALPKSLQGNPFGSSGGGAPAEVGGWRGVVSDVLNNPVAKVALKPLEILDVPRRVLISGIKEGYDFATGGDASLRDFAAQVKDPTFGAGKFVNTGNKWADRILGFVGDVALDPLTYASFGANQFAGMSGRFALANMAKNLGFDAGKVARIAMEGRAALTAEEIARLGINKSGLYFFGKRLPAVRVAGTQRLGELAESTIANLRLFATDTKYGKAIQKAFTSKDYTELRLALARGEVPTERVKPVLSFVVARDKQRQAAARALVEGQRRVVQVMSEAGEAELAATRGGVHKFLERPDLLPTATPAERAAVERWSRTFGSFFDDVDGVMKQVDGSGGFGRQQNYFPHMPTEDALKWMREQRGAYSREVSELIDNPLDPVSVFQHRKLQKDREWFGHTLTEDDLNVERLNELARAGGFVGDFFETDIVKVAEKYVGQYSDQMGIAHRLLEAHTSGASKAIAQKAISETVVDEVATAAQAAVFKSANEARDLAYINLHDSLGDVIAGANVTIDGLTTTVAARKAVVDEAGKALNDALEVVNERLSAVGEHAAKLRYYRNELEALVGGGGAIPISAGPLFKEMDGLIARLDELKGVLASYADRERVLQAELDAAVAEGKDAAAAVRASQAAEKKANAEALRKVAEETRAAVEKSRPKVADIVDHNLLISENYELMSKGTKFSGKNATMLNDMAAWLGHQPLSNVKRGRPAAAQAFGGSVVEYIKTNVKDREWFKRLTGNSKISATKVSEMNVQRVEGTIGDMLNDAERHLEDGRTAGLWVLARDEKAFGDEVPHVLAAARDDLVKSLETADASAARVAADLGVDAEVVAEAERLTKKRAAKGLTKKEGERLEELTDKIIGGSRATGEGAARRSDLQAVAQEISSYTERLSKFQKIRQQLEASGLANSTEELTDEGRRQIGELLVGSEGMAERNAAAAADGGSLYGDVVDYGDNADAVDNAAVFADSEDMGNTQALADESVYSGSDIANAASVDNSAFAQRLISADSEFQKALAEAIDKPIVTYADLYRVVADVEQKIGGKAYTVGKGTTAQTYTVFDGLVPMSSKDGKSVIERALESSIGGNEAKRAMEQAIPAATAAKSVVAKLTLYSALSETYQRFTNVVAMLAQYGVVPTKEMLRDITSTATEGMRQYWRSHVARLTATGGEGLEEAQAILEALDNLAVNPSDELLASMLDDAAQRVRGAADVAKKTTPALDDPTRSALGRVTDTVQQLKSDPMYVKAQHDKDMLDAMLELAGTNLDEYALPNGYKGFMVTAEDGTADLLSMPDGTPLAFTKEEWDSLYKEAGKANDAEVARIAEVEADIRNQSERLARGKQMLTDIEKKRVAGKATTADMEMFGKVRAAMDGANRKVAELQSELTKLRQASGVLDPEVQRSALEKMRILVHGNGEQAGWFTKGIDVGNFVHRDPQAVVARRARLQAAWDATPEAQFLAKVQEAAAKGQAVAQRSLSESAPALTAQAEQLEKAAAEAAERAAKEASEQAAAAAPAAPVAPVAPSVAPSETAAKVKRIKDSLDEVRTAGKEASAEARSVTARLKKLEELIMKDRDRTIAGLKKKLDKATTEGENLSDALDKAVNDFSVAETNLINATENFGGGVSDELQATRDSLSRLVQGTDELDVPDVVSGMNVKDWGEKRFGSRKVENISKGLESGSGKQTSKSTKNLGLTPEQVAEIRNWLSMTQRETAALKGGLEWANQPPELTMLWNSVVERAQRAEANFIINDLNARQEFNILSQLERGENIVKLVDDIEEGWKKMASIGLPNTQMPDILANALTNVRRAAQPDWAKFLNRFLGKYTRFFKAYATLSPGFHVRNALSNTFAVVAAGAEMGNMSRGLKLYRSLIEHIRLQGKVEDWLSKIQLTVSPEEYKRIEIAVMAMESAGGGRVEEAFADFAKKGQRLSDNAATRASRRVGERVEGSARFMLAYDSAAKGLDFNAATARVKRYLFDYTDIGSFDENIRQIIPFWIWMSRNLPLQMVNQWANPRAYAIYTSMMRNMGQDDSNEVVPSWLKEQGGIKIADGWYLAPDVGFTRVRSQLSELGDPARLLSYVNPALRLPVELLGGRKLYNSVPFSTEKEPVAAGAGLSGPIGYLADLLGQAQQDPSTGERMVDPRFNYAMQQLNPFLARAERLLPAGDEQDGKQLSNWLSFFGVPVKQVTQGMRDSELRRQQGA